MPTEQRVGDRRRGFRKGTILFIGVLLGLALWEWRYMINGPIWLYRAAHADSTPLYQGSTNSVRNLDLVNTARGYIRQFTQIDVNGRRMSNEEFRATGVRLDPGWFDRH